MHGVTMKFITEHIEKKMRVVPWKTRNFIGAATNVMPKE